MMHGHTYIKYYVRLGELLIHEGPESGWKERDVSVLTENCRQSDFSQQWDRNKCGNYLHGKILTGSLILYLGVHSIIIIRGHQTIKSRREGVVTHL